MRSAPAIPPRRPGPYLSELRTLSVGRNLCGGPLPQSARPISYGAEERGPSGLCPGLSEPLRSMTGRALTLLLVGAATQPSGVPRPLSHQ